MPTRPDRQAERSPRRPTRRTTQEPSLAEVRDQLRDARRRIRQLEEMISRLHSDDHPWVARVLTGGLDPHLEGPADAASAPEHDLLGQLDDAAARPVVQLDQLRLTVEHNERRVRLTPTEWSIMLLLLRAGGRARSREDLAADAWGSPTHARLVEVYVCRLRRKLSRLGIDESIETVRGLGYRAVMTAPDISGTPARSIIPRRRFPTGGADPGEH